MSDDTNFKSMTSLDYIDFFIYGVLVLTEQNISFDMSRYNTLEEGFVAQRKMGLQFSLKAYGKYSVSHDSYTDNGDILQIGLKRFFSDIKQLVLEDKFTIQQQIDIENSVFEILFSGFQTLSNKIFSSTEGIPFATIMFFLYEYVYRTPVHTSQYNFDSLDMRRNVFGRLEIVSLNKFHDYKLNKEHFQSIFLDTIKNFSLTLEEILSIVLNNKEVEYRTELLNRSYFNIEHFLSVLVEHFSIPRSATHSKQTLLADVLNYFGIDDEIILSDVTEDFVNRCVESDDSIKKLFENVRPTKQKMTDMFLRLINMRNSLHSNGFVSKNENALMIGDVVFSRTRKGEQHNSMGLLNVVTLLMFMSYILEKIVDESFKLISTSLIEDRYLREMQDHRDANEENSNNDT